ncbi:hypothetical protein [Candidatus Hodarchaeum mangrovi]
MDKKENIKGDQQMKRAYEASSQLLRRRLAKERPEDLKILDGIKESDIIVVEGIYDHAQVNFNLANIPHSLISPRQLDQLEFSGDELIFINCPGDGFSDSGIEILQSFVLRGGMLITTDWALKHVLERVFPGFVEFNNRATPDDVVRVEILDGGENSFIHSVIDATDDPQWWLEGSSYPIRIINHEKVKILVNSREMKEKYGESPIIVSFKYGEGEIIHMTSHFYLQRTETRTVRHQASGSTYAMEKGFSPAEVSDLNLETIKTAEIESAYTSQAFMADLVTKQKKKVNIRKKETKKEK